MNFIFKYEWGMLGDFNVVWVCLEVIIEIMYKEMIDGEWLIDNFLFWD